MRYIDVTLLALLILACSACVTTPDKSAIQIKRLVFHNQSSDNINNVRLYVTKTRESMSCGYVIANTECSTGFPLREYRGNKVQVTWDAEGRSWKSNILSIKGIDQLNRDKPVNVSIIFKDSGSISAHFVQ